MTIDIADMAFRRRVERLCTRPRLVAELLAELGAERAIQHVIDEKARRYDEIDDEALAVTGGDSFPALPVHAIRDDEEAPC